MSGGLLVESKSVPRSGHHLLKELVHGAFGASSSHCERYQEPGCCQEFPCRLASVYLAGGPSIRLTKSHDLRLEDPVRNQGRHMIVVQYRHPVFSLCSYLILMAMYKKAEEVGININKLNYIHESTLIRHLMSHVNEDRELLTLLAHSIPSALATQVDYQKGFFRKWGFAEKSQHASYDKSNNVLYLPYEVLCTARGAQQVITLLSEMSGLVMNPLNLERIIRPLKPLLDGRFPAVDALIKDHLVTITNAANQIISDGCPYPSIRLSSAETILKQLSEWSRDISKETSKGELLNDDGSRWQRTVLEMSIHRAEGETRKVAEEMDRVIKESARKVAEEMDRVIKESARKEEELQSLKEHLEIMSHKLETMAHEREQLNSQLQALQATSLKSHIKRRIVRLFS